MGLPPWADTVLALLAFVIGGGTIGPWVAKRFRAGQQAELETLLATKFATVAEFNGFRQALDARVSALHDRVEGILKLAEVATENADNALDAVREMKTLQESWQQRLAVEVMKPLDTLVNEVGQMGKSHAATTALLQRLIQEVDRRSRERE